jgi:hypothetical protein
MSVLNWFHLKKKEIINQKDFAKLPKKHQNTFIQTNYPVTHTLQSHDDDDDFVTSMILGATLGADVGAIVGGDLIAAEIGSMLTDDSTTNDQNSNDSFDSSSGNDYSDQSDNNSSSDDSSSDSSSDDSSSSDW